MTFMTKSLACVCALFANTAAAQETLNHDWAGGYIGGFAAGSFFSVELSDLTDTFTNDAPTVNALLATAGANIGYNWTPYDDNLLLGLELGVQGGNETNQLVRFNAAGTDGQLYENTIDTLASINGRAGVINGNLLTYFTGGIAAADVRYRATDLDSAITSPTCDTPGIICSEARDGLIGLSAGMGIEYAFRENTTMRFQVMHYMLPTTGAEILNGGTTPVCSTAAADECSAFFDSGVTQIQFGVNFKF